MGAPKCDRNPASNLDSRAVDRCRDSDLVFPGRGGLTLAQALQSEMAAHPDLLAESVLLLSSILMGGGVFWTGTRVRETYDESNRLRDSESRYQSLFNEVRDGIVLSDSSGRDLNANHSALRMFGYSREEFAGLDAAQLFPPEELELDPIDFASLRQGKKLLKERRLVRKDESVFHAEISSTYLATGQMAALIRDVSERHHSEQALRANEALLRAVLNSVFDAVVTVDLFGTIVECNHGACTMFREQREGLIGTQVFGFLPRLSERWEVVEEISDVSQEALRWESLARDSLEREFPVELNATAAPFEEKRRIVISIRDLSGWNELQTHVLQTQKMEALGTLAGGVAHDFNNILMVLLGNVEMTLEDLDEDHVSRVGLERALGAARRGKELVAQILTFSRMEPVQKGLVDMNPILDESVKLLQTVVPASMELVFEFQEDLPRVSGDATQLQQVFVNLMMNACQSYGVDTGRVEARCRVVELQSEAPLGRSGLPSGHYIEMVVEDSGCGIPATFRDRIFDPFFTTKKAGEGTGMGLSVALGIIETHEGMIELESEEGRGSSFRVLLPIAGRRQEQGEPLPSRLVKGRGKLIVLVDDQEPVLHIGKRLLERIGFYCEAFSDARLAIEYVEKEIANVVLVITDLSMPVMSGLALTQKLNELNPDLPIVLTTGNSTGLSAEELSSWGVGRLLSKPFSLHDLSDCVSSLFGGDTVLIQRECQSEWEHPDESDRS